MSTTTLRDNLDLADSLAAVRDEMDQGSRQVVRSLPYLAELDKVETSLFRANAIIPGYADGYVLDLVRIESEHLDELIRELLKLVSDAYPDRQRFPTDGQTGRLTAAGREQKREACDNFLELSRPVMELIDYLLSRVSAYPTEMRKFIKEWQDTRERVDQMRENTYRNRNSPRA